MFLGKIGWLSLASMACAQLLKPALGGRTPDGRRLRRIFDTGGMPSSHTALVTTLTLCILELEGSDSALFSIAWIFSLYFVFEATGLRQEVGQQARVLNQLLEELSHTHHVDRSRLKELVGHTWQEVLAGAGLGTLVYLLGLPWLRRL
jgi:acid phosphatase family membrane protein YuiD